MKKNRDIDKFNGEELVEMAIALEELASNDYDNWEYGQAAKTYQIIIEFYERAGDSTKVAELMEKKELALRALAEEGKVYETIEDIEVLDKLADDAYDSKEYETAASFYQEILHIISNGDDVKQIADYYYLYGICLCQAEKYDEGIKSLEISHNLEKKINGGVPSKTTRAIMEEICDYSFERFEQNCSHYAYYHRNLAELFKEYESLKEYDYIRDYTEYMNTLYDTYLNERTLHIKNNGSTYLTTEPKYSEWDLDIDVLCDYFAITKDEHRLLMISEKFKERCKLLLTQLDARICISSECGIKNYFSFGVSIVGSALRKLKMTKEACDFFLFYVECMNNHGRLFFVSFHTSFIYYRYALSLSEINKKEAGLKILHDYCDKMLSIPSDEYRDVHYTDKTTELGYIYCYLGYYYQYELKDYKKAIETYKEGINIVCDDKLVESLGDLYTKIENDNSAKSLYTEVLERNQNEEIHDMTIRLCRERLADIAKDEFNYTEAVRLYTQLIADAPDVFERERYKKERYRCMAYAEVDTIEVLQEVERYFAQRAILESQESLETIQDINALAYGYISYANHLADENEAEAQKYFRKGKDTYQKFFSLSEDLLEEAIRNENRRDILAHIKEYDRTLQHYLELINKSNIGEMFDCVAKYQSFAFEVDRLLSQKNGNAFKRNNVAKQLQAYLDDSVCILNYVLFYEKDIRRYGVFVLQKQKPLMFYKLGNEEKINAAILSFKECITDPASDIEEFNRIKLVLQNELLSQIELDDVERVYVVRAHGLEGIPFHSLLDKKTSELVSTMSYLTNYDEEDPDYNQIVIFSNPQFEVDNYGTRTTRYQILEGSRIEGNLIRRIYPENQTTSYEGINANVNELARALQENEAGVFHISSHHVKSYSEANGYMDSSKLILAGANNLTEDEAFIDTFGKDGTISAAEISRINMSRKLVVLAACKTGGGDVVEGGGLYGLSRAFYQHGCKVISTLYDVGDYPTAVFFKFFYESLRAVGDVENAIIEARRKMQRVEKGQLANIIQELPDGGKRGTEKKRYINQIRMTPRDYPYSPPYYWVGYIIGGR